MRIWRIAVVFVALLSVSGASFAEKPAKNVLMLVTGASTMTSGKPTGLWLEEFAVPYNVFIAAGYKVTTATINGGPAPIDPRSKPTDEQLKDWADAAAQLRNTVKLASVPLKQVDAIFIPGGHGVMFDLASDPTSATVIGLLARDGKVVAAVCHGPAALVDVKLADGTPLVKGKTVAAFTNEEEAAVHLTADMPFLLETRLTELGAKVDVKPMFTVNAVRDGKLITGQNPPSSAETARLVIEALNEPK